MLQLLTSTNSLAVYGFCRHFVDSPRSMIDDLIALVIKYYDCDAFCETCIPKYLTIKYKDNLSTIQVTKNADQNELQFGFGTKTVVINFNNNNIYSTDYNCNKFDCKTDKKILPQKWNLIVDGRHKKGNSHVCCGIGIMNVNDIKCLQKTIKENDCKYRTGSECYHSDMIGGYKNLDHRMCQLGPLAANRLRWIESKFIGFCCVPVNTQYCQQPSFHSLIACNKMRHVKYDDFEKKNQCLLKKGDTIELSIECEKSETYLYLKRINKCDNGWKCMKQSIGLLQSGKYQLVVWLRTKKTRIQVL